MPSTVHVQNRKKAQTTPRPLPCLKRRSGAGTEDPLIKATTARIAPRSKAGHKLFLNEEIEAIVIQLGHKSGELTKFFCWLLDLRCSVPLTATTNEEEL